MTIRLGVIGLGIGMQHASRIDEHPGCELQAICDNAPKALTKGATAFPHAKAFNDAREMLSTTELDAVVIASWDNEHYDHMRWALQASLHMFVEKPLCQSESHAAEIATLLNDNPKLHMASNLILRLSPRFRWVKTAIEDGTLGTPYLIESDYNYGRLHKLLEGWRGRIPGYAIILGGGVHVVDLAIWYADSRVKEVFAYGNRLTATDIPNLADELTLGIMKFENGIVGKITANGSCVCPHFHRLIVYGSNATFENFENHATLTRSRKPDIQPEKIYEPYPGVKKTALLDNFIQCLEGTAEPILTTESIFHSLATCLALAKSSKSGRPEPVREFLRGRSPD